MLKKLEALYNKRDWFKNQLVQVTEDIELLETLIMYQYNKKDRRGAIQNGKNKNWADFLNERKV